MDSKTGPVLDLRTQTARVSERPNPHRRIAQLLREEQSSHLAIEGQGLAKRLLNRICRPILGSATDRQVGAPSLIE